MHAAFSFQILQILLKFQVFGDKKLTRLITLTFFPSSVSMTYSLLQTGLIKTTINSGHAVSWISLNNICLICCIYIYMYTCLISE